MHGCLFVPREGELERDTVRLAECSGVLRQALVLLVRVQCVAVSALQCSAAVQCCSAVQCSAVVLQQCS